MNDVSGKATDAERESSAEVKERTNSDKESAENEESSAEFAEGIHQEECRRKEVRK